MERKTEERYIEELAEKDAIIAALSERLVKAEAERDEYIRRYNELVRKRYRKSSEVQDSNPENPVFNETELNSDGGTAEDEKERGDKELVNAKRVRRYVRKKSCNTILSAPASAPVVTVRKLSFEGGSCPVCGAPLEEGEPKTVDRIVKVTVSAIVRTIIPGSVCHGCGHREDAPTSDMLIDTACDPAYLASVITSKMRDSLPLYRQEGEIFPGTSVSRQLLSSWIMYAGDRLNDNLIPLLEEDVISHPLVNCDETGVNVVMLRDEDGKKKGGQSRSNAFMVVRVGVDAKGRKGPVIFSYSQDRKNDTMKDLLKDIRGCLQTDGLSQYGYAEGEIGFVHLGCLVHARRKAVEALGNRKAGAAKDIVDMYGRIFHEEGILTDAYREGKLAEEEFVERRKSVLLPLFGELRSYMEKIMGKGNPGRELRIACNYFISRYEELIRFLDYSYATSSNQIAENAIRPFAVGRRNFLFCFTECGAEVSAAFYSLVQSCINLGIDPEDYLTYLFLNAGSVKDGDREAWKALLPGHCDVSEGRKYREMIAANAAPDPSRTDKYILRGRRVKYR